MCLRDASMCLRGNKMGSLINMLGGKISASDTLSRAHQAGTRLLFRILKKKLAKSSLTA